MKVLFICTQSPWPARSGAPMRTQGWIKMASRFVDVGLVALSRSPDEADFSRQASQYCAYTQMVVAPFSRARLICNKIKALVSLTPFYYQDALVPSFIEAVREAIDWWQPDLVQVEWIGSARYMRPALERGIPCIYSAHNLEQRIVAGPPDGFRRHLARPFAARMASIERHWAARAVAVAAVTTEEAEWFSRVNPKTVVVPNALMVDEHVFRPPPDRQGGPVAFIGNLRYAPNRHAATVLMQQIFPRIRGRFPELNCLVAGLGPDKKLQSMQGDGISVLGNVADMTALWSRISLIVCPLTWGAGSRLKLLEAATCGVPIVSTPMGAEGLSLLPGKDYLAAQTPEEMAQAAIKILSDQSLAARLAENARHSVETFHNWHSLAPHLRDIYVQRRST